MSLILEALKKSEKEREDRAAGEAAPAPEPESAPVPVPVPKPGPEAQTEPKPAPEPEPGLEPGPAPEPPRRSRVAWIAGGAAVLGALGLAVTLDFPGAGPGTPLAPPPTEEAVTAEAEAKAAAETKAAAEAKTKAEAEAKAAAEAKAEAEAEAKAAAEAKAEAEAEAKAAAEAKAEAEAKAKAEAKAEAARKKTAAGPSFVRAPKAAADADAYTKRGQAFEQEGLFDRAIEEYTQAILLDPKYIEAYFGRAWAHEAKGGHEQAIRNFTQVLDLSPDFAEAFFGRGWAYEQNGQAGPAIDDYAETVRLRPDHAEALFSRGFLQFYRGRMDAAVEDFSAVFETADGSLRDYALIWRYVSQVRNGRDMVTALSAFKGREDATTLPGVLISLFLGKAQPADVLDAARDPDGKKRRENECIAYFFLAQDRLIRGDEKGARDYFLKTLGTGVTHFRQYPAAKIELERLRQ